MGNSPEILTFGCPSSEKCNVSHGVITNSFYTQVPWRCLFLNFPTRHVIWTFFVTHFIRAICKKSHYCHTSSSTCSKYKYWQCYNFIHAYNLSMTRYY